MRALGWSAGGSPVMVYAGKEAVVELIQASRLSDDDAKLIRSLTYRLARLRKPHRQ